MYAIVAILAMFQLDGYDYGSGAWYQRRQAEAMERQADAAEDQAWALRRLRSRANGKPGLTPLIPLQEEPTPSVLVPLLAGAVGAGIVIAIFIAIQKAKHNQ